MGESARLLVVDNHDSFVHTIVGYLRYLGATVELVRNEARDLVDRVSDYDGVLVSPGPGVPSQAGQSLQVIDACAQQAIPMLGVCLGHQALAEYCGGRVKHAPEIVHGATSTIRHDGTGLFAGLPTPLTVTRYHSLVVDSAGLPAQLRVTATTDDGTVMALAHRTSPLLGVQFHPEAVLTQAGHQLFANWLATLGPRELRT